MPDTNPVPESVLKKRQTAQRNAAALAAAKTKAKSARKQSRKIAFKNAASYVKEYRTKERDTIAMKRQAREHGNYYVEPEAKLMFAIRIRGQNDIHPKTRKILQLLRLRQLNNGVFIKANKASINMLRKVEPYVTYGYPTLKTIREVIYKRGFGKVAKQRIPFTDNSVIEGSLGEHGIICVEDLIHEIYTVGPHFKEANNFLWPFKLSNPRGGWVKKGNHFIEGGDAGNREALINSLVASMN